MDKRIKIISVAALFLFVVSTMVFFKFGTAFALTYPIINERELGEICIEQVISAPNNEATADKVQGDDVKEINVSDNETEGETDEEKHEEKDNIIVDTEDPLVIIYHTHATESYMPYNQGNYHKESEEGTVRDVGDVLEKQLKQHGINVIHDKTLHDRPSYNESYSRSLETVQTLQKKYPTAVYIIDLHRDAASAAATTGNITEVDGVKTAQFSMVVGKENDNYTQLIEFASKVKKAANTKYPGISRGIIEQNYRYNGFVSDKWILLEVGNNKNTIDEARQSAKLIGTILSSIISDETT